MKSVCLLTTVLLAVAAVTTTGADLHSRFAPGKDFTVRMLTKDTPTTLEDHSVYYLTNTLALNGGSSHNPSQPGAAALSLPENATVYIYIPSNMTLSCTGGAGCPAASGGAQQKPRWDGQYHNGGGITHTGVEFTFAPGGAGGTGASGGGPGILVPSSSTLVVFGGGTLNASGGAGGAAAVPTNTHAKAGYAVANWCGNFNKPITSPDAKTFSANNLNVDVKWTGTCTEPEAFVCWNFQSVSGGGGCGGGGGGGAAIGTAGGGGGGGADGARQTNIWSWEDHAVAVVKATGKPGDGATSAEAGKVYIALPNGNCNLTGGAAGRAESAPSWNVSTNEVKFTFYAGPWDLLKTYENRLYCIPGGAGGVGGAGAAGALIGTGGGGGGGGSGGDTGACTCELTEQGEKANVTVNVTPQSGNPGGSGMAATTKDPLDLTNPEDYPYSTVTLENITVTNQYYFSLGTTITLPTPKSSSAVSWRLEQPAEQLVGVPNSSSAFLSDGPADYLPNTDVTVGVSTYGDVWLKEQIRVLPKIPYRVWNEVTRQMEDRVCTNYTVVTDTTTDFADGQWYAVTNAVSRGTITVRGAAHLILCDGAKLTATGRENEAGVAVADGNALTIYGQILDSGDLVATAGYYCAGIGGTNGVACGTVTINGGRVTARATSRGAGIGGGSNGDGGVITINGGVVKANGHYVAAGIGGGGFGNGGKVMIRGGRVEAQTTDYGASIGGGSNGNGGEVTIEGGTVVTKRSYYYPMNIGGGISAKGGGKVTISGGSVKAAMIDNAPSNVVERVYCVTAKCEGLKVEKLKVEGLENYGTNDIYAVDNRVYLWLPKGTHRFSISDGTTTYNYCAVMKGVAITVEPLAPVGFFVNGVDIGKEGAGTGWVYMGKNLTLNGAGPYVLSGEAANDEVHIHVISPNAATVILSNAVVFVSENPPALNVNQNTSLLMSGGTSYIAATNDIAAVTVGANVALTVGLAPDADETESMICAFNYGNRASVDGAGSVAVNGGTLAVCADRMASAAPLTRAADVFCMLAGDTPETAKVVDKYNGEAYVLVTAVVAPVTPGTPVGPFTTPEEATNAAKKAVLAPRDDVEAALGSGAARQTYCDMFGFAVTGGGESWFVEAVLHPEAWTNVVQSAQAATRQIPVAAIAALPTDGKKDVSVTNCVPGFYYTLYGAAGVRALPEGAVYGPELSGVSGEVTFPQVVKPSAAAGFFSIGVKEAPSVQPSDRAELDPPAITDVKTAGD